MLVSDFLKVIDGPQTSSPGANGIQQWQWQLNFWNSNIFYWENGHTLLLYQLHLRSRYRQYIVKSTC
jgi:hypothetical protein